MVTYSDHDGNVIPNLFFSVKNSLGVGVGGDVISVTKHIHTTDMLWVF